MGIFRKKKVMPVLQGIASLGTYANINNNQPITTQQQIAIQQSTQQPINQLMQSQATIGTSTTGTWSGSSSGSSSTASYPSLFNYPPGAPSVWGTATNVPYTEKKEIFADVKQISNKESIIPFFDKFEFEETQKIIKICSIAISILTDKEINMHRFWFAGKLNLSVITKQQFNTIMYNTDIPLISFNYKIHSGDKGEMNLRGFQDEKHLMNTFLHAPKFVEYESGIFTYIIEKDLKLSCSIELDLDILEKPIDILCGISIEAVKYQVVA